MDEYVVTTNGIDAWPTKRIRFRSLKLSKSWKITIVRRFVATNFKDNFARKYRETFFWEKVLASYLSLLLFVLLYYLWKTLFNTDLYLIWTNEKNKIPKYAIFEMNMLLHSWNDVTFPLLIVYFFFENMKLEGTLEISYWKPTVNITNSIRIIPIPSSLR